MKEGFPNITDFPVLSALLDTFKQAEVFLVGGAVRDLLLGKKITDIDMLVRNVSGDDLEEFLADHGRVVFAGRNFGVWKFNEIGKPDNQIYDIALPRTEFSMHKQGIYRDFDITTDPKLSIEKDLERRDFTINSMAYNLSTKELVDLHNGKKDLQNKVIRTMGNPKERFTEDYSRILRALSFSLQLDFSIEEETMNTIKSMVTNINNEIDGKRVLPYEVASEEFLKSLNANPVAALDLWDETGALAQIIPELLEMKGCAQTKDRHTEGDVWNHTRLGLEKLSSQEFKNAFPNDSPDLELIVAILFHDIGKPHTAKMPDKKNVDNRVRFDDHDTVGSKIGKKILDRIKISAPPDIGIDTDNVAWMIHRHMILVHGDPQELKPSTIEKYFFNPIRPSQNLLKLLLIDGLSSIGPNGKGFTDKFEQLCKRIEEIKKITGSRGQKLVQPLINGDNVMEQLKLKPGKKVGKILEDIRQKQLSGELKSKKDALDYLKKL